MISVIFHGKHAEFALFLAIPAGNDGENHRWIKSERPPRRGWSSYVHKIERKNPMEINRKTIETHSTIPWSTRCPHALCGCLCFYGSIFTGCFFVCFLQVSAIGNDGPHWGTNTNPADQSVRDPTDHNCARVQLCLDSFSTVDICRASVYLLIFTHADLSWLLSFLPGRIRS